MCIGLKALSPLSAVRNHGVTIDSQQTMADHVSAVCRACYIQLRQLRAIHSHQRLSRHSSTPSSVAALTTVIRYPVIWHRRLSTSAAAVCAERCCEAGHWFMDNGAHHADPALVTESVTGDLQAGNGAHMPYCIIRSCCFPLQLSPSVL